MAGACFILPAALIVTGIAWAYVQYGTLAEARGVLYGIKPVIIAVVVQALWGLGKSALKNSHLAVLGIGAAAANLVGTNELLVLFAAGVAMAVIQFFKKRPGSPPMPAIVPPVFSGQPILTTITAGTATAGVAVSFGLWPLFLFFLKVGAVLYGSGYVLLAFLRSDLVERFGWLTESQLLDAIAVGQMIPGPVFTTATFIGYLLGGLPAAGLATLGIFLPAFFFVAASGPLIPRLRRSPIAGAILDGVNVASLALMAVVTWHLGRTALVDWPTVLLALAAAVLLLHYRLNSAWLVLGGATIGLLKTLLG